MDCAYCSITEAFDANLDKKVAEFKVDQPVILDDATSFITPNNFPTNPVVNNATLNEQKKDTIETCNHLRNCPQCRRLIRRLLQKKCPGYSEVIVNVALSVIIILLVVLLLK